MAVIVSSRTWKRVPSFVPPWVVAKSSRLRFAVSSRTRKLSER